MATTIGKLYPSSGDLELTEGEVNERLPVIQDGLALHFPFDTTKEFTSEGSSFWEPVEWSDTTRYGVSVNGNTLTKSLTSSAWDSGAISVQSFSGVCSFQWEMFYEQATYTTAGAEMVGFNSNHSTWSYTDIDYAIYTHCNGNVYIYENSTNIGILSTWNPLDINVFRIDYDGTTIYYYHNNNLLRSVTASHSGNLYIDCSMHSHGKPNAIINAYVSEEILDMPDIVFDNCHYDIDNFPLDVLEYNSNVYNQGYLQNSFQNLYYIQEPNSYTIDDTATVRESLDYDLVICDAYTDAVSSVVMEDLKDMADAGAVIWCSGMATGMNVFVDATSTLGTETETNCTVFSGLESIVGDTTTITNIATAQDVYISALNRQLNIIPLYYHDEIGESAIMGYLYVPLNGNGGSLYFDQMQNIPGINPANRVFVKTVLNWQLSRRQISSRVTNTNGVIKSSEGVRVAELNRNFLTHCINGYTYDIQTPGAWLGATLVDVGESEFGTRILQYDVGATSYTYSRDEFLDDELAILSGQTVTWSLYIRSTSGDVTGRIRLYDNVSGYSYQTVDLTGEFQRFSITKTFGASPTRLFVMVDNTGGGTYEFHTLQLEKGSTPTPYLENENIDRGKIKLKTDFLSVPVSICFDFYLNKYNYGGYTTIINNSNYNYWFWVGLQTSTNYIYMHESAAGTNTVSTTVPDLETWYNVIVTISSDTQTMYLNGESFLTISSIDGATAISNMPYLYLGWGTPNDYASDVIYKNLSFYNKILSQDEIDRLQKVPFSFRSDGNLIAKEFIEDGGLTSNAMKIESDKVTLNGEILED